MLKGIGLKVGATLAFSLMATLVKAAAPVYPVDEIVLFRSVFALVTLAVWLHKRGEFPAALRTARPLGHVGRSLAGAGGMFCGFIALSALPLADATAFTFASPLMVVPLAALTLGEDVPPARWAAVLVGFGGVIVMLSGDLGRGGGPGGREGALIALAGATSVAVAMIQTRRLTRSEATGAIVFYFTSVTTLISLAVIVLAALWPAGAPLAEVAMSERFLLPTPLELVGLVAVGLLGGVGQILMTHSYRYADASVIAAFDYVAMVWAAALGFLAFGETPSPRALAGAAIVIAAGLGVLWREREAARLRLAAPPAG